MSLLPLLPKPVKDGAARLVNHVHRSVFDLTKGAVLGRIAGMPAAKVTTTGARSGRPRTVMLTVPARSADGYDVLVASYGGDDRYPAWYHNLNANPQVEVVTRGRRYTATARTATAAEKAELWPTVTRTYKGYAGYQRSTERDIPLVILEEGG